MSKPDARLLSADPDGSAATLWDRFVGEHPHGHVLQSWGWGAVRAAQGWRVERILLTDAGRPIAAAQVQIRGRFGQRFAYIPRGPVVEPGTPAWSALRGYLRDGLVGRLAAVRYEPHWPSSDSNRRLLGRAGLREVEPVQPPSTLRIDLGLDEETLLSDMKSKWRYNVRLSARKGVQVVRGTSRDIDRFEDMVAATAARHDIPTRPAGYHATVWRHLPDDVRRLYVARYQGAPLAMIFVTHFGDTATYLYGASTEQERQRMPNHALQWAAIRGAIEDGLRWYDMWGVPDAVGRAAMEGDDPDAVEQDDDGLWGVWRFKRGFGGEVWRAAGAWDDVLSPISYQLATRWLPRLRAVWGGS